MATGIGYKPFSPSPSDSCLCGSDLKFSECCARRIPGSMQIAEWSNTFLETDDLKEALYAARAETTKYTIFYKSHTEPAIRAGMPKKGSLFEIDIRAMSELVATLMSRHVKAGLMQGFPAVLERLRTNIPEREWQRKIIYFHSLHALWPDGGRDTARREFTKLGSVADDNDEEILQLRLDLFYDELSFSQRLDLIDRILAQKLTFTDRLQFRGAKAVQFIGIGDNLKADEELAAAVNEARAREEDLLTSQQHKLAQLLSLLGSLRRDAGLLSESLTLHNELLDADYWTPRGKAILLGDIAEIHKHKGEWEEARDGYSRALQIQILPIHKVFLAECLLQLERHEEALAALAEVEIESLSNNEQIDYAFVTAGVAIQAGTREQLDAARIGLKELHVPEPLFRERRDSILLNVQEAISSGSSKPLAIGTKRLIANTLRSATTYLILKPSFMGVGVDIGKWVEKRLAKSEQPPKPPIDSGKSVSRPDPLSKRK